MKFQIICSFVVVLILAGCATTQQPETQSEQPELITMTSLPPVSTNYPASGLKLKILFHIRDDGSVTEVKMIGSSVDPDWDRVAIDSMKKWQFAPFRSQGSGAERWIRNTIILQVQEPTVLTLGELSASSQEAADSLYALVDNGSEFEPLMKQVVSGTSELQGRFIGAVDIARYPKHVRDALRKLGLNQMTHPLRIGSRHVIFKRYKPDGIEDLPQ